MYTLNPCLTKKRAELLFFEDTVLKRFFFPEDYLNEKKIYALNLDSTPDLINDNGLDELIIRRIQQASTEIADDFIPLCIQALVKFHHELRQQGLNLIHYDTNPRNYLQDNHRIYMIDFSEIREGRKESDILSYFFYWIQILKNCDFDSNLLQCRDYLHGYHFTESDFTDEINRFNLRRRQYRANPYLLEENNPMIIQMKEILL